MAAPLLLERADVLDRQMRVERADGFAHGPRHRFPASSCPHEDAASETERRLGQRHVGLRQNIAAEAELPHVADDANHRQPRLALVERDAAADRVAGVPARAIGC